MTIAASTMNATTPVRCESLRVTFGFDVADENAHAESRCEELGRLLQQRRLAGPRRGQEPNHKCSGARALILELARRAAPLLANVTLDGDG